MLAKTPKIVIPDPSRPAAPVGPVGPPKPIDPVGPVGPGVTETGPIGPSGPVDTAPKMSQAVPVHIQALPETIYLSPVSGASGKSIATMDYA